MTLARAVAKAPAPTMATVSSDRLAARVARPIRAGRRWGDTSRREYATRARLEPFPIAAGRVRGEDPPVGILARRAVKVEQGAAPRFRIIRPISEGGMGVVHEAEGSGCARQGPRQR